MTATGKQQLLFGAIVSALVAALFHFLGVTGSGYDASQRTTSLFVWLSRRWIVDAEYGNDFPYGWAAPLASLWMVWHLRRELAAEAKRESWAGFGVVIFALLLHWLGLRTQQPRVSLAALLVLIWGIPFHLFGWRVARRLSFPVAFLLFTMPFDLNGPVLHLRSVVSAASAFLLNGLGLAMHSGDATSIRSDGEPLIMIALAHHAGGVRSLMYVAAAALSLGWARPCRATHRIALVLFVPLLLIVAGIVRTTLQALVWRSSGEAAGNIFGNDAVFYVVAFALLGWLHFALSKRGGAKT